MNLVSNSIRFTAKGRIIIDARLQNNDPEGPLEIEVSDTGLGIPQAKLGAILNSFEQVDVETTKKCGGHGLGLALVRQLVEAHGGSVGVKSAFECEESGTTFTILLPLQPKASGGASEERGARMGERRGARSEKESGELQKVAAARGGSSVLESQGHAPHTERGGGGGGATRGGGGEREWARERERLEARVQELEEREREREKRERESVHGERKRGRESGWREG